MFLVKDRVKQGTTTQGIGNITLSSSFGGYQDFSVLGNGTKTFYTIEESTNWEVGIGTYNSNVLSRDTVVDSASGLGIPINLSGSATVFIAYPASGAVFATGDIASITGVRLGVSGVSFNDGSIQTTAASSFSSASGLTLLTVDTNLKTVMTTGVATAANLIATGVNLDPRIRTIEASGLPTIDTNLKAVMQSGEVMPGASGITLGVVDTNLKTVMTTGVAFSGSAVNLASSGLGYSNRISTIESSGLTPYVAGTGLTLIGNEFNTTGTGHFDQITFTDDNIQIGDVNYYSVNTGNVKTIEIGWNAGGGNDNNSDTIFIGRNAAGGGGSDNDDAIFIGTQAGHVATNADYSTFIGYDAGAWTSGTSFSNIMGFQAAKQPASSYKQGPKYSNIMGYRAGYDATGSYNQYIGYGAGRDVSGDYNIEIQTYAAGNSILGDNSNKLNIESTQTARSLP